MRLATCRGYFTGLLSLREWLVLRSRYRGLDDRPVRQEVTRSLLNSLTPPD